jgi:hypothetical protein
LGRIASAWANPLPLPPTELVRISLQHLGARIEPDRVEDPHRLGESLLAGQLGAVQLQRPHDPMGDPEDWVD